MKSSTLILLSGLAVAFTSIRVSSDESVNADEAGLREQVKRLRAQVDLLMAEHHLDGQDIAALTERVKAAERVQTHIQALYKLEAARGGENQLHQANAELRLAQARLEFAKKDYDAAINHFDAALAAAKRARTILNNRLDAGTVSLDFLISAQQSVVDIQLEKNRARRKLELLGKNDN